MKQLKDILENSKTTEEQKDRLFTQVEAAKRLADGIRTQYIQRFNESYDYYNGKLPGPLVLGKGTEYVNEKFQEYVEPVLANAIKAAMPQLLSSFTEDDSLAFAFRGRGFMRSPAIEELVTYNINKIFLREQDGYQILENMFKEALITGDTFGKVYIDQTTHREKFTLPDWMDVADFMSALEPGWKIDAPKKLATNESGKSKGLEWKEEEVDVQNPETGETEKQTILLIKGRVSLVNHEKKVKVEHVDSNDLWVDTTYGHDFSRCPYICHRIRTTVGEAKLRGFDEEKLKNAGREIISMKQAPMAFSAALYDDPTQANVYANLEPGEEVDEMNRKIDLYEHYIKSSILSEDNETRLYQVTATDTELLRVEEIKRFPFIHGQMETVVGDMFGRSMHDAAKRFQDQISIITRLALVDAKLSAYPRWVVSKDGGVDRQSLLQTGFNPGAVIEERVSGALREIPRASAAQEYLVGLQNFKQAAQEALVQPIDISTEDGGMPQAAASAIALKLYQDAQKGKLLSKTIARTLIRPLVEAIYHIIKDESFDLETPDGQIVEGMELPNLFDFVIDVNTVNDDFAQYTQLANVSNLMMQLSQVPMNVMSDQNKYEIGKFALESFDMDVNRFLTDPSQNQDQFAQQEAAEQKAKVAENDTMILELNKMKLRHEAAKVFALEQDTEEKIRNGTAERKMKPAQIQAEIQRIINENAYKSQANQNKAAEIEMKQDLGNKEFLLAANHHAHDIASATVNGVR